MTRASSQMKTATHECTKDDVGFVVEDALLDNKQQVVDLTGASVRYVLWAPGAGSAEVDQAASIIAPPTNGQVRYTFTAPDTDTAGVYLEQWKVTFGGGAIQRFPSEPHLMWIRDKVAP